MEKTKKLKTKHMSNTNKIVSIVSMSVIGLLILTAILLAVIPVYTLINFQSKPYTIDIIYGQEHLTVDENDSPELYNKIWNTYIDSSKNSVMGAIFSGYAGKNAEPHYTVDSKTIATDDTTNETFRIVFYWEKEQTMLNANGTEFKYKTYTTSNELTYNFKRISFVVSNKNEVTYLTSYAYLNNTSNSTRFTYTSYNNLYSLNRTLLDLYNDNSFGPLN